MSSTSYPNVYNGTLLDEIIHEQKLSAELVKKAAREVFVIIKEGLLRDGMVRINHFGTFKLKRVAARKGHNPQTGKTITIAGRAKVIFTPCKALREMIEPVHHKPVPLPIPVAKPAHISEQISAAIQPVAAPVAEPALLKTTSESSVAIERITDIDGTDHAPRKRGRYEKAIYLGIAATIIAMVVIKSMPRKVEPAPQIIAIPLVTKGPQVEPMVITELEVSAVEPPVEVSADIAVDEMPAIAGAEVEVEVETQLEVESELAQIIASQIDQQRVVLEEAEESSVAPAAAAEIEATAEIVAAIEEPNIVADDAGKAVKAEATDMAITDVTVIETTPAAPQQEVPVAKVVPFFTERLYQLESGNSLWRLSARFYSEPLYWPYIYHANADKISNPDKLYAKRSITMPTLEGGPGSLTNNDREGIAEGYFLTYLFYKQSGHRDAFFALLEAKRYSAEVVERKRHTLTLSAIENIMLDQQQVVANL
jgi:nucleoid DNA-binding protein/nucleoid-associated protein YgaU